MFIYYYFREYGPNNDNPHSFSFWKIIVMTTPATLAILHRVFLHHFHQIASNRRTVDEANKVVLAISSATFDR